ncbi:MAG: hypothetical protein C0519_12625 [Hyphomicrobium sp.]|jgi:hypothetical protein|nr:hypothetical protein [Hyphomicrobium sp.]PPD08670.1 MAG: hypothetical protein CTY28_04635 [Hyphomicrobium sp.]
MLRVLSLWVLIVLLAPLQAVADARFSTPKMGSAERKAVLDAARVPVEKDLGQDIVFQVKTLRVTPEWAFVYGTPKRPDGKAIDYSKSIYAQDVKDGSFNEGAAVLLAREAAGWRLVTYSVGFGDVVWDSWDEEFGAPAWLWP